MKRGTPDHPKVKRLARLLAVDRCVAVGILEGLWHFASDYTPAGDVGRFSDEEIAEAIGTSIEPGRLVEALVSAAWLEHSDTHRLLVHDWHQHCEDSIHAKLARAGSLFANGATPSRSKLGKDERQSPPVPAGGIRRPSAPGGGRRPPAAISGGLPEPEPKPVPEPEAVPARARETPPPPPAEIAITPEVEAIALKLEAHPSAKQPGCAERRERVAATCCAMGQERVERAVSAVASIETPEAQKLRRRLAVYPDGLTPERVEFAEDLARDAGGVDPPPDPALEADRQRDRDAIARRRAEREAQTGPPRASPESQPAA